jgi:hypothetical protein
MEFVRADRTPAGRAPGDFVGKLTCHAPRGSSVVDDIFQFDDILNFAIQISKMLTKS